MRLTLAIVAAATLLFTAEAGAATIPDSGTPSLPDFSGAAATKQPIKNPTIADQNPYMADNPNSNIHNDTWMTDSYNRKGPLGKSLVTDSYAYPASLCGSVAFDSRGRIVTVCPSIPFAPQVRIIDPNTMAPISTYDLPTAANPPGTVLFQNFSGGGYFYLDNKDRIWVATKTNHILRIDEGDDGNTLQVDRDYDLTSVLDSSTERITSALPDFSGRIWFVSKHNAKIGVLNPKTRDLQMIQLGPNEEIENSFAVGSNGIYVVSNKRMYKLKAGSSSKPRIAWQAKYPNSGIVKPSQVDAGSGTTPTIMDGGYVAITDNADPMNVVVYRTKNNLADGENRAVCKVPVFEQGASATENSLMGTKRSVIVENNYGYQDPFGPNSGAVTTPGFARIDIDKDGKGCTKKWTNTTVSSPTVVPKLSTKTGLVYTYARPADPSGEGYYWTAIDYRTGETAWSKYAGSGVTYNNNYAGIALGSDGTAYLGVIGGIVSVTDGN